MVDCVAQANETWNEEESYPKWYEKFDGSGTPQSNACENHEANADSELDDASYEEEGASLLMERGVPGVAFVVLQQGR